MKKQQAHLHLFIFFIITIFILAACGDDDKPTTAPASNAQVTSITNGSTAYLLVVNTDGDSNSSKTAASTGTLPSPKVTTLKKTTLPAAPTPKNIIKDKHTLSINRTTKNSKKLNINRKVTYQSNTYTFTAYTTEDTPFQLTATNVYGGASTKCVIFVANGEVGAHDWNAVGTYFDNTIFDKVTNIYGSPSDVDNNNKVVILYYGITNSSGTANNSTLGFFWGGDLYSKASISDSNEMEIFYMNLNWAAPDHTEMRRTLAHEFQHMINFGNRQLKGKTGMDTWINEGLAESAEHYALGTPGTSRITTINNDSSAKIRNGQGVCIWTGDNESYALVYTFMQYCRIQATTDSWSIFTQLINHTYGDYRGLVAVMNGQNSQFSSFGDLAANYKLANLIGSSSGLYGYKGESGFSFTVRTPSTAITGLKAGGGVYFQMTKEQLAAFTPSGNATNIRFVKIYPTP